MTSKTRLSFSVCAGAATLLLAACGGASTPPEADAGTEMAAESVSGEILAATVLHGEAGGMYQIAWDPEPADTSVRIEVSTDPDFEPGTGTEITVPEFAVNMDWQAETPGQRHYFAIIPEGGEPVKAAARLLPLEGGRNFRDLGGYATEDGHMVKWGHVYRSGQMSGLTDTDYAYLSGLGIRTLCDFRDARERVEEPTDWRAGDIDYLVFADPPEEEPGDNPMFSALLDPTATPEDVKASMAEGYWDIAIGEIEGYTAMFDDLATGEIPLAFNCSAGKDRAGTAAALILTALGVPRETVVHDYALSDDYVDYMAEFLNDEARAATAEDPTHPYGFLFQLPREKVAPLMASHPEYIEASFARLEADYGSVLAFIQAELDVDDAELAAIRQNLLQ